VVFGIGDDGFTIIDLDDTSEAVAKSAATGITAAAGLGVLALLAGSAIARRRSRRSASPQAGLGQVRQALTSVRGNGNRPQQPVTFGTS